MMKRLIGIMLLSIPIVLHAQQVNTKSKKVSEVVRQKIQAQLEDAILTYKQFTCPEIKRESYTTERPGTTSYKQAKGFFLDDSIETSHTYKLIFDSIEPWGPQPSNYGYYIVTKRGHRFTNFIDTHPYFGNFIKVLAYQDTISLDLYSKYYPQDERYLVYCDTVRENRISLVSGNIFLTHSRKGKNSLWQMVRKRMVQYNISRERTKLLPDTKTHERYIFTESNLTNGGFLLEIEREYPHNMQITYHTNNKALTGGNGVDVYQIILPRPVGEFKGYEPIKPKIRKLEIDELRKLRKDEALSQTFEYINYDEF
jgi:hypothetical protein